MNSEDQFTEDIRVRVPKEIREAFQRLKRKRLKKESELVREALLDYLARNGETIPGIAGGPLDTHAQLSERIQRNESEVSNVADKAANRAVSDLPGSPVKPPAPEQSPEEVEVGRMRRKVVGIVRRAAAKTAREEKLKK